MTRWSSVTLCALLCFAALVADAAPARPDPVQQMRDWAMTSNDHDGQPFIVIDKQRARLWLFDGQGQPLGDTAILLGSTKGDASVPGIGERPMKDILPHERTTPAGRFMAEAGHNAQGEDIFWVDYDAAVSMHRVRARVPAERRLQRLASPSPADNRISYGCVNVPVAFYEGRLKPALLKQRNVIYVLPETMPLTKLFIPHPQARQATPAGQQSIAGWGGLTARGPDMFSR